MIPSIHNTHIQASISWHKWRYSYVESLTYSHWRQMRRCYPVRYGTHILCDVRKELMLSDRISGSSRFVFALKWTCSALCRSHRCEAEPPSSPTPHGSVHVTPARRFTAVQDVLLITPAAKEEQTLSLSVAAGMFLSLCVLRSAVLV